jgi:tripartite-type tricarboxylate transporter receptor subunit TctC
VKYLIGAMALALSTGALAQAYPSKPIRMAVGIAPGGGLDASARIVATKLGETLGQQIVVENRAGAGGTIAAASVASAPPDGYTLLYGASSLLISPALYDKLAFDPVKSFTAIGSVASDPLVIVVNPAVPAKGTAELISLLKANPGKYSYGSPGVGSIHHLGMEMFGQQTGTQLVHVPYKGAAGYLPDVVSGTLPMAVASVAAALPQAKAGKLRVIAITGASRLSFVPDWPIIAEVLPGFDVASSQFLLGPAGMTGDVVTRLNEALRTTLNSEDTKKAFAGHGGTPQYSTPEALAARIRAEAPRWVALAKETGAKP